MGYWMLRRMSLRQAESQTNTAREALGDFIFYYMVNAKNSPRDEQDVQVCGKNAAISDLLAEIESTFCEGIALLPNSSTATRVNISGEDTFIEILFIFSFLWPTFSDQHLVSVSFS
jgi:hypothetical protein